VVLVYQPNPIVPAFPGKIKCWRLTSDSRWNICPTPPRNFWGKRNPTESMVESMRIACRKLVQAIPRRPLMVTKMMEAREDTMTADCQLIAPPLESWMIMPVPMI